MNEEQLYNLQAAFTFYEEMWFLYETEEEMEEGMGAAQDERVRLVCYEATPSLEATLGLPEEEELWEWAKAKSEDKDFPLKFLSIYYGKGGELKEENGYFFLDGTRGTSQDNFSFSEGEWR